MEERRQRGGVVWPIILIGLGALFLLTNLGVLESNVWWTLLRMWPVLLIAAGIDLLIGRQSAWGSVVAALLIIAVFVGAFWLARSDTPLGANGEPLTGNTVSQPLGNLTQARIELNPVAAELRVGALASSGSLIEGTIQTMRQDSVTRDYQPNARPPTYVLSTRNWTDTIGIRRQGTRIWNLNLTPAIPLELNTDLVAGEANLDLSGLNLTRLDVSTVVGQTTITLPREGRLIADISGVLGEVVLLVPRGMEVRIESSTLLGNSDIPRGYETRDNARLSPGYDNAESRADIKVSIVMGNLRVQPATE